jgi:glutamine amidotransferase
VTQYIEPFAAAVDRANVMGVQFHPEKSGATGLRILRNFLEMGR